MRRCVNRRGVAACVDCSKNCTGAGPVVFAVLKDKPDANKMVEKKSCITECLTRKTCTSTAAPTSGIGRGDTPGANSGRKHCDAHCEWNKPT